MERDSLIGKVKERSREEVGWLASPYTSVHKKADINIDAGHVGANSYTVSIEVEQR